MEDVQRERAYAQAEEQTKRRLAPPPAKKAKYTLVFPTPTRVLAELDQTNPWVAAANQVLLGAATAAASTAAAPAAAAIPPPTTQKAATADPAPLPKAPTEVLVRDKKTGKLTGKINNTVRREQRRTMGPNRDLILRKVKVDIYQRANPSSSEEQ